MKCINETYKTREIYLIYSHLLLLHLHTILIYFTLHKPYFSTLNIYRLYIVMISFLYFFNSFRIDFNKAIDDIYLPFCSLFYSYDTGVE
jgi:hypothetical protein